MRYVEVLYKCRCMKAAATVHVPERHATDDVVEWVGLTVGKVIADDHRARSPLCTATVMEYAKFEVGGDFIGQGKGGTA